MKKEDTMPRKPKTEVAEEAGQEATKAASGSQIRMHWLAMSRYTNGRDAVDALRAAHLPYAKALFQALVNASALTFRTTDDTTVTPRVTLEAGLRSSYDVVLAGNHVRVTKDDILRCLDIAICAIRGGKATNVSVFSQADFDEPAGKMLTDLRALSAEETTNWSKGVSKLPIDLRKFAWALLIGVGILPDTTTLPDGIAHKVILANVQGKYTSLLECAALHADLYKTHVERKAALERAIGDADFVRLCSDLLKLLDMRKIDSKRLQVVEKLLVFALDADRGYDDYAAACRADKYTPQQTLFDFFRANAETMRKHTTTIDGKLRVSAVAVNTGEDSSDVSVFELLNEMQWLVTHSAGVKYPKYTGDDYGIKLGNNYFAVTEMTTLRQGDTNLLRLTFRAEGKLRTCDFVLGRGDITYWNNLQFEPDTSSNNGNYIVTKTVRRFDMSGRPVLMQQRGLLKEPEIRYEHGVLGLRLPISWETATTPGDNSVTTYVGGKKNVFLCTTPFGKSESFQSLLEYRNSTAAADGYIYVAGFDQGESDQHIGIYRTKKYSAGADITEFFDRASDLELVAHHSFSEYQANKRVNSATAEPWEPIRELEKRIKMLKRLISTLGAGARGDEIYAELKERRRGEWSELVTGLGMPVLDFDVEIGAAEDLFHTSRDPEFGDVVRNPAYIVNTLKSKVAQQFRKIRDSRVNVYISQHQNDFAWLRVVDAMISLQNAINFFGKPSARRNEVVDIPETSRRYIDNLHTYRDNLMAQFRKEVAAFLRDACLAHGVRMLAIEELKPASYITDDTDANRKRTLFAPAELHKDIELACSIHDIAVVTVDETLTSREAPNGRLGFRSNKNGFSWKDLHYIADDGTTKAVHADETATANITKRMYTCGASKPRFTRPGLLAKDKGPVLLSQLAYQLHRRRKPVAADKKVVTAAGLELVEAGLGTKLRDGKGFIYVDGLDIINSTERKARQVRLQEAASWSWRTKAF
jgi:hypothetical protein